MSPANSLKSLLWVRKFVRITGILGLLAIAFLALVPGPARPHVLSTGGAEHFFAYALTALFVFGGYWSVFRPLALSSLLSLYAGFLELCQLVAPGREAKFTDFGLSVVGVWTALLLVAIFYTATSRLFPSPRT